MKLADFINSYLLSGLSEREKFVLTERENSLYGFGKNKSTLDELASKLGLTRERIRQIEGRALRRISYKLDTLIAFGTQKFIVKVVDETTVVPNLPATYTDVRDLREWFSVRSLNCLVNANFTSIEALTQATPSKLLQIPNLGRHSLREIEDVLHRIGLRLKNSDYEGADV